MALLPLRILYATDLSAKSIEAFRYAVNYAIEHEAKLMVFHVISKRTITLSKIIGTFFNEAHESTIKKEKCASAMKRMKDQLEIIGRKESKDRPGYIKNVEKLVVHYGDIAEEIVEKADTWDCESILIGHRKGFFRQILPGAISRKVLRLAHKPVHFVPLTKEGKQ
jgi:nucleotide-binding universal stress UspA family protein